MSASVLLVLAQGSSNTQQAPDSGPGAALIIGTLLAIVLVFTLVFLVISKRARAGKGGVEPVPGSREPGPPPLESVERDR